MSRNCVALVNRLDYALIVQHNYQLLALFHLKHNWLLCNITMLHHNNLTGLL